MNALSNRQIAANDLPLDEEGDGGACAALRAELRAQEPVMAAACLASVAFRMRDERGLILALRELCVAVDVMTRLTPANDC